MKFAILALIYTVVSILSSCTIAQKQELRHDGKVIISTVKKSILQVISDTLTNVITDTFNQNK